MVTEKDFESCSDELVLNLICSCSKCYKNWEANDLRLCHKSKVSCSDNIERAVKCLRKRANKEFMTKADKILQEI